MATSVSPQETNAPLTHDDARQTDSSTSTNTTTTYLTDIELTATAVANPTPASTDDLITTGTRTIQTITIPVYTTSSVLSTEPRPPSGVTTATVFSPHATGNSNSTNASGGRDRSGLSTGAIAGVGIGVGLGIVFLVIGIILVFGRRQRKVDYGVPVSELPVEERRRPAEMGETKRHVLEMPVKKRGECTSQDARRGEPEV
ncbi:hypothetical protein BJX63DRAFT_48616 [Aspergillus granulosus]|uniref:Mid2 domain-containing protein n=1 Tax=Aspergillus granulosus TaxID=176169 RepID=A0ABR4HWA2_9EURO